MTIRMKHIAKLLSLGIIFAGTVSLAVAQTNVIAPPGVEEQISVTVTPEHPEPEENVTVKIQSFSFDINKAYIIWSVNGVKRTEGPGDYTFEFTTGKAGTVQRVTAEITTEDQRVITRTFTFAPAEVGLVIEADTYTPPYYKGKALFSPQSNLKVVAFPELVTEAGYRIPAENLVYTWKVDGKVMQDSSGYGKSSMVMEGKIIPRPMIVSVDVSAYNSPLTATKAIEVVAESPELLLYEDNLLYGILRDRSIPSGASVIANEVRLIAEPYFLSVHIPESADVRYEWTLNGERVSSLERPHVIGLENRSGESGRATLGLNATHISKLLQIPSTSLVLQFGENQ